MSEQPAGSEIPRSTVLDLIRRRYSCRSYKDRPVPPEVLDTLKEAVRWAPSACNRQPYRFLFVSDSGLIETVSRAVPLGPESANAWIRSAPLLVAAVGRPEMFWHRLTQVIDADYHRTDAVIAMDHLSLAATELGLGTCWIGWFHRRKVGRILGVGRSEEVVILMTVGYPHGQAPAEKRRKKDEELFEER